MCIGVAATRTVDRWVLPPKAESIFIGDLFVSISVTYVVVGIGNDLRPHLTELIFPGDEMRGDSDFFPHRSLGAEWPVRAATNNVAE